MLGKSLSGFLEGTREAKRRGYPLFFPENRKIICLFFFFLQYLIGSLQFMCGALYFGAEVMESGFYNWKIWKED